MTALTLYHAMFSTCSQKVRYALAKKGLEYESRIMDFSKAEQLEDWYLEINPNGVVPSLTHNGVHIHDSSVICEYVDEVFPDTALTPSSPVERARMRAWMRYFEEVPTAAIRVPSFNKVFAKEIAKIPETERLRRSNKMPLRKQFYQKMRQSGFAQDELLASEEKLRSCLKRVDGALTMNGGFLLGSMMTLADIVLLPTVVRMVDLNMSEIWQDLSAVSRWYRLMTEDAAFEIAFPPSARIAVSSN